MESRDRHAPRGGEPTIIGRSLASAQMIERVKAVAATDAAVLITGESGVGKELVARLIHQHSARALAPLVTVNCASIPRELFESEFFGHVKGAFTGALRDRAGRFELAHGGTLFLDEVGEIPVELQSKLLRSLEQRSFERIGDETTRHVDVRFIAASNRQLETEVKRGRFREDLFYRLSVFPVAVPPLRERRDDIAPLAQHFLDDLCIELHRPPYRLTAEQIRMLEDYDWPGNVRELGNVMERAVILCPAELRLDLALPEQALRQIPSSALPDSPLSARRAFIDEQEMRRFERNNTVAALEHAGWRVAGSGGAAALLGVNASTLSSRLRKMNIARPSRESLYTRLGGIATLRRLIDELLPAARSDPQLGRFWQHRGADSIRREKELLVSYLCEGAGGPYRYEGRSMAAVHEGMGISDLDWHLLVQHVDRALDRCGVPEPEHGEVLGALEAQRADIVERTIVGHGVPMPPARGVP